MSTQKLSLFDQFCDYVHGFEESALEGIETDFLDFMEYQPIIGNKAMFHEAEDFDGYTQYNDWIHFLKDVEEWAMDVYQDEENPDDCVNDIIHAVVNIMTGWMICNNDSVNCINNCVYIGHPEYVSFVDYDAELIKYLNDQEFSIFFMQPFVGLDDMKNERYVLKVVLTNSRHMQVVFRHYNYKALKQNRKIKFSEVMLSLLRTIHENDKDFHQYFLESFHLVYEYCKDMNQHERDFRVSAVITELVDNVTLRNFLAHSWNHKAFQDTFYDYLLREGGI